MEHQKSRDSVTMYATFLPALSVFSRVCFLMAVYIDLLMTLFQRLSISHRLLFSRPTHSTIVIYQETSHPQQYVYTFKEKTQKILISVHFLNSFTMITC